MKNHIFLKLMIIILFVFIGVIDVKAEEAWTCEYVYSANDRSVVTIAFDNKFLYVKNISNLDIDTDVFNVEDIRLPYLDKNECPNNLYYNSEEKSVTFITRGQADKVYSKASEYQRDNTEPRNGGSTPGRTRTCSYMAYGDDEVILTFDANNNLIDKSTKDLGTTIFDTMRSGFHVDGDTDKCPTSGLYYYETEKVNPKYLCISLKEKVSCPNNTFAGPWKSLTLLGEVTGYDDDDNPIYSDTGDNGFSSIDNSGNLSCEEILGKAGVKLLHDAFLLMRIAAPILFIALNMLDFMKGISGDAKREMNVGFNHIVIRSVCCALLYLLPYLLNVIFKLAGIIAFDSCGIV